MIELNSRFKIALMAITVLSLTLFSIHHGIDVERNVKNRLRVDEATNSFDPQQHEQLQQQVQVGEVIEGEQQVEEHEEEDEEQGKQDVQDHHDEVEEEEEQLQQQGKEEEREEEEEENGGEKQNDAPFTEAHDETQSTTLPSSTSSSKFAIFFNTFSATNETEHAHNIISSQFQLINNQPILDEAPLYYTRIGELDWEWPISTCKGDNNRTCIEIIATEEGDEVLSLQPMYEYCVENPQQRVIYMHSKGAFTSTETNDQLRTLLMTAILSEECLNLPEDGDCDTCSTQFVLSPFVSYMGNMFVANCNYVTKLIPPKDYQSKRKEIIDTMLNRTHKIKELWRKEQWYETKLDSESEPFSSLEFHMAFVKRKSWVGIERYANEHWITGHPDLRPCEVFSYEKNPNIVYGQMMNMEAFQAPELNRIQESMTKDRAHDYWITRKNRNRLFHAYFSKVGRLYEYRKLYGKIPQDDSWFNTLWSDFQLFRQWQFNFHTFDGEGEEEDE